MQSEFSVKIAQIKIPSFICFFTNFGIELQRMKKSLNILIAGVAVWCAGIILAPIITFVYPTGHAAADILYRVYGVVCHQIDTHSFHINNHSFAVCIRCTAIYFGFLIAVLGIRFSLTVYNKKYNPIVVLLCSSVPMLLDVVCSFTPFYEITTLSRSITGVIFGIGMALLLHRSLTETISSLIPSNHYEIKTR
jgi:uncharacterized membrane protein